MKTKCPRCSTVYDIREAAVLEGAAAIIAKRRKKAGNQMTSEQARERQAKSVYQRRFNQLVRDATPAIPSDNCLQNMPMSKLVAAFQASVAYFGPSNPVAAILRTEIERR